MRGGKQHRSVSRAQPSLKTTGRSDLREAVSSWKSAASFCEHPRTRCALRLDLGHVFRPAEAESRGDGVARQTATPEAGDLGGGLLISQPGRVPWSFSPTARLRHEDRSLLTSKGMRDRGAS